VQFLYLETLEMPWDKQCFPRVRVGESVPVVLAPEEVTCLFDCVTGLKYARLLAVLRCYWRVRQPRIWLFPSWRETKHLSERSLSTACRDASRQCGLTKRITAHTLRHSSATPSRKRYRYAPHSGAARS
jgi:hypothetical protein